jgi:hypothetical protein
LLSASLPFPCFGICSASLTPVSGKAGYPSAYVLQVTLSTSQALVYTNGSALFDSLVLTLPGFDGLKVNSVNYRTRPYRFSWNIQNSLLVVRPTFFAPVTTTLHVKINLNDGILINRLFIIAFFFKSSLLLHLHVNFVRLKSKKIIMLFRYVTFLKSPNRIRPK